MEVERGLGVGVNRSLKLSFNMKSFSATKVPTRRLWMLDMTEETQSGLALISTELVEMITGYPAFFTLITAALASTAVLSIGNSLFSRVWALRAVSDARTWDDAWPSGGFRDIANDLRSNITRTEKIIAILSGLGLANMVAIIGLLSIILAGLLLYLLSILINIFKNKLIKA